MQNHSEHDLSFFHGMFAAIAVGIGGVVNFAAANEFSGVWSVPLQFGFLFEPSLTSIGFSEISSKLLSVLFTSFYIVLPCIAAVRSRFLTTAACFVALIALSLCNTDGIVEIAKRASM